MLNKIGTVSNYSLYLYYYFFFFTLPQPEWLVAKDMAKISKGQTLVILFSGTWNVNTWKHNEPLAFFLKRS